MSGICEQREVLLVRTHSIREGGGHREEMDGGKKGKRGKGGLRGSHGD